MSEFMKQSEVDEHIAQQDRILKLDADNKRYRKALEKIKYKYEKNVLRSKKYIHDYAALLAGSYILAEKALKGE